MPADELVALLQLGCTGILHPEKMIRLESLAETTRFNRSEAMVNIMEKVHIRPNLNPKLLEKRGNDIQIFFGRPESFGGKAALRGFIWTAGLRHAIACGDARYASLRANRQIAAFDLPAYGVDRFADIAAIGVGINENTVTGLLSALPLMSQSATSTALMAVIVTGPRRQ
jgi:hypothetical protein